MKPLLTIAIPTWNRSEILDESLQKLFKQFADKQKIVEVIVSDNVSTDRTKNVVLDNINKFNLTNIKYNRNDSNLGHYGNYKMCRKLSKGEYLWLLSDDDHIKSGILDEIIIALQSKRKPGGVYLDGWGRKDRRLDQKYHFSQITIDEVFAMQNVRPTLLSSAIFLNDKSLDDEIEKRFKDSAFLCFGYFVNTKRFNDIVTVLCTPSLEAKKDRQHSYNWFKSFVEELGEIYIFMKEIGYQRASASELSNEAVKMITSEYISLALSGASGENLKSIRMRVGKIYWRRKNFYKYFIPATIGPNFLLKYFTNRARREYN